jgi:hypothetical protein
LLLSYGSVTAALAGVTLSQARSERNESVARQPFEPTPVDRTVFVAEIEVDRMNPPKWIDVVLSIAGRESTFRRRWTLDQGVLSIHAANDLTAWLTGSSMDALIAMVGIQEVLPLA